MKFVVKAEIAAATAEAFATLSDCRNETRWNTQVSKAELVSEEPVSVGTRFRTVNRGKPYSATIVTFDAPQRLAFDVKGPIDMVATFTLTPQGAGCVLDGELEMRPKGFLRFMFPMLRSSIQKDADKQYENFARLVESDARGGR